MMNYEEGCLVFSPLHGGNEDINDAESPCGSPKMWRPGSRNYNYYYNDSVSEEIAKSRQELMKLVEGLPESCYDLSLSDLVEKRQALKRDEERDYSHDKEKRGGTTKVNGCNSFSGARRSSVDSSNPFLLNIFVPRSFTCRSCNNSRSKQHPLPPPIISKPSSPDHSSKKISRFASLFHSLLKVVKIRTVLSSYGFSKVSPKPSFVNHNNSYEVLPTTTHLEDGSHPNDIGDVSATSGSRRHSFSLRVSGFFSKESRSDSKCCSRGHRTVEGKEEVKDSYILPLNPSRNGCIMARSCLPFLPESKVKSTSPIDMASD